MQCVSEKTKNPIGFEGTQDKYVTVVMRNK
jgi:hypothetical protein